MRFYDREKEQQVLGDVLRRSKTEAKMTVLMGRRRIGKTELSANGKSNADMNNDGKISIIDLILGQDSSIDPILADVNLDHKTNIDDVVALIDMLLNK